MKLNDSCLGWLLLLVLISLSTEGCVEGRVRLDRPGQNTPVIKVCEGSLLLWNPCRLKILDVGGPLATRA